MMDDFAERLLTWFEGHGRKDLPWQQPPRSSYRVWISEIMLQQTQVRTVIPYFMRFTERFPDIPTLAAAPLDEVLHHWSGLGYYQRARHLHASAKIIQQTLGGHFPTELETLLELPGISRSTAGAILALALGQRHPILDGNVKRVLARYHGVEGWPGQAAVQKRLWELAGRRTPAERVAEYTQAIMDLGAICCTRHRPQCPTCPLQEGCAARQSGIQSRLPTPNPRTKALPTRKTTVLIVQNPAGEVLLERRPLAGVWGGLWSFPECSSDNDPADFCRNQLRYPVERVRQGPRVRHTFTHFHLELLPVYVRAAGTPMAVMESDSRVWYNTKCAQAIGLAAPVSKLIKGLSGWED
jgi:A/G-specific adenine glycosylase